MENCGGGQTLVQDEGGTNVPLSGGASTEITALTLGPGDWVVIGLMGVVIPSGLARMIGCSIGINMNQELDTQLKNNNTNAPKYFGTNVSRMFHLESTTRISLYGSSNGSDVVCNYRRLQAIKIKP